MPTIFEAPAKSNKTVNTPVAPSSMPPSKMRPFTTFAINPDGVRFETQEAAEDVILFLRQHIIVNVPWIVVTLILASAPTIIFPLLFQLVHLPFAIPAGYLIVGALFWYLATFGYALANFIAWFFNIYIVTNERVVDIDFIYLLYKQFSEAELMKTQDISYATGGMIAMIFGYGNVTIETAGETPNLTFKKIPYPERVVETIRSLTGKPLQGKEGGGI